jgi:hypothetical protein
MRKISVNMMNLKYIKKIFLNIVKLISIILVANIIGLELCNVYAVITLNKLPNSLNPFFWIGRFVIAVHLIEAIIAAFYAPSRKKIPIQYGTYTFFVGTVSLLELFDKDS